jgi:hypothetical protein
MKNKKIERHFSTGLALCCAISTPSLPTTRLGASKTRRIVHSEHQPCIRPFLQ